MTSTSHSALAPASVGGIRDLRDRRFAKRWDGPVRVGMCCHMIVGIVCGELLGTGAFLLWFGTIPLGLWVTIFLIEQDAAGWRATDGLIVASEIDPAEDEDGSDTPRISYRCQINQQECLSDQLYPGGLFEIGNDTYARAVRTRYPVGRHVLVWFDPRDASRTALETSFPWLLHAILWLLTLLLFGFGIALSL